MTLEEERNAMNNSNIGEEVMMQNGSSATTPTHQ